MTIVKELDALHVNWEEYKFPANEWDMKYSDFSLVTKSGATVTLDLFSEIEPSANFTVNAPSEIKEGQMYILRVTTWATPYTMTLWTWITNPYNESTTLTANTVHQFGFLAIDWDLELQPSATWWVWWTITWTLSNQTDLQTALNAKANASDVNTKTFDVEELTVSELQPVMDFYANWWYPIIYYSDSWTEYPRRRWYYTLAYPPSSSTPNSKKILTSPYIYVCFYISHIKQHVRHKENNPCLRNIYAVAIRIYFINSHYCLTYIISTGWLFFSIAFYISIHRIEIAKITKKEK